MNIRNAVPSKKLFLTVQFWYQVDIALVQNWYRFSDTNFAQLIESD